MNHFAEIIKEKSVQETYNEQHTDKKDKIHGWLTWFLISIILAFAINLISLIGGDYDATGMNSLQRISSGLVWQVSWFVFLCQSQQVNSLFPKEERKLFKRDKILLFTIVVTALIWLLSIFVFAFHEGMKQQSYVIDESTLGINEYTDRLVSFEPPEGLTVEKYAGSDGNIYFFLNDDNKDISVTVYGAWDENDTPEYFEETMQSWADDYFDDFEYFVNEEQDGFLNGNKFRLKTLQYYSEPVLEWTFVLIFDKETGKCCVISYFSSLESNHLKELINSVRFK